MSSTKFHQDQLITTMVMGSDRKKRGSRNASGMNGSSSSLDYGSQHSTFTVEPPKSCLATPPMTQRKGRSPSTPSAASDAKPAKKFQFCKRVAVKLIRPLSSYTEDEHVATWYQMEEMDRIKKEVKATLRWMMKNEDESDDPVYCTRGLECRLPAASKQRQMNKLCARQTVMSEQERQWWDFDSDTDDLSQKYIQATRHCQTAAFRKGRQDEREARQVYNCAA